MGFDNRHPPDRQSTHSWTLRLLHIPPHRLTCDNGVHPHCAQALVLLLWISSWRTSKRTTAWMERSAARIGCRLAGMTPAVRRLYGCLPAQTVPGWTRSVPGVPTRH